MDQIVILAGGKGTRLQERLGGLPKPLVDICGEPLLKRQILLVKRYGFKRVLILVNHLSDFIIDYCSSQKNWGLEISFIDDGEPRGTAGAVLHAWEQLDDEFLLLYGDTMLEIDLHRFIDFHSKDIGVATTLFLHPNDHPMDSDLVSIDDDGYITDFSPYPHLDGVYYQNLVNAGLYCVQKKILGAWKRYSGKKFDFGKDIFPSVVGKHCLRGYKSPEYIKDCGTPERLDGVCADFLTGKIARASLCHKQMAVFVDRDGTLNLEVGHLCSAEQLELLPYVGANISRLNKAGYRVCVVTNQPVIARGGCSDSELKKIHNKFETLLGEYGAYVDRIYSCPHHPDRGFVGERPELKINCNCRKPKTGMIEKAVKDLNIDISRSWMIGDTTTDILLAQNAGLRSVLVKTGYAGLDKKYPVIPDYTVQHFGEAVALILDQSKNLVM